MAKDKEKIKKIIINVEQGTFNAIFSRFRGKEKGKNSDLSLLRSVLSNEKARMLHVLKSKQPNSIYELAKLLGRDFKAVRQDITVLEKFGLIEMIPIHKGKREKLKPLLVVTSIEIAINF